MKNVVPNKLNINRNIKSRKKYGFSFSWKRALGITSAKQKFARETGIPTSKVGMERKIGKLFLDLLFKKNKE